MARQPPLLTVVIGANGAGKSTWCRRNAESLPDPFFDADSIAQGLGSYDDPNDQRRARAIVDQGIAECLAARRPFGFETTYSGKSRPELIREARRLGYRIECVFVGTETSDINVERVALRVAARTGHDVLLSEIHRRWQACQDNLAATADCFHRIQMLDNTSNVAIDAVSEFRAGELEYYSPYAPQWARSLAARLTPENFPGKTTARENNPAHRKTHGEDFGDY